MLKRAVLTWGASFLVLLLTASSAFSAPAAQQTVPPTQTPVAVDTFDPAAAGGRTIVKWYVGLGTGADPKQIETERAVVDQFNKSQERIYVALQIVENRVASTTLATQIAAGNVPDIVGPVGTVGRATFDGNYLDLTPYIQSTGMDLSMYDQAVVNAYNIPGQGQIGLPFAVFPSFVYYNKDLFDEAGLPYPPQNFGETYQGREWNWDTLRDLSKKLTVDDRGNDATSPDFQPDRVVQFGFDLQFGTDPRAMATTFGANRHIGVIPSYNGVTTAKLHADSFVIMKATKNPDAAFEVYRSLIANPQLFEVYGAMPAIGEMQSSFFRTLDQKFAPVKVNWQVAVNSLAYPDVPNHEEGLPNFLKARQATTDFQTLINTTPGLDIDQEAVNLQNTLQGIYEGR